MKNLGGVVGVSSETRELVVSPARVQEFLHAVGYQRVQATSRAEDLAGTPVPPGFLLYVSAFGAESLHGQLGLDYRSGLFAGHRMEVREPVRTGDELAVTARLGRTVERPGGLRFSDIHCDYVRGTEDRPVLVETSTIVQFGPEADRQPPASTGGRTDPDRDVAETCGPFRAGRMDVAYMTVALRDPNPVHIDDAFAAGLGLARPILHGTFAIFAVVSAATAEWDRLSGYEVALRSPIFLDEEYVVELARGGGSGAARRVAARAQDGRLVADGKVTVKEAVR